LLGLGGVLQRGAGGALYVLRGAPSDGRGVFECQSLLKAKAAVLTAATAAVAHNAAPPPPTASKTVATTTAPKTVATTTGAGGAAAAQLSDAFVLAAAGKPSL